MKIKSKIATALVALGIVAQAGATNIIYLTGSTAFRSTVYTALHTSGTIFDSSPAIQEAEFGGSSAGGASYMIFLGNISGTPTYIDCAWNGSEAGIACASGITIQNVNRNGSPIALAGNPQTWLTNTVPLIGLTTASPSAGQLEPGSHIADLSMADTSQAVSLTPAVAGTATALKDYGFVGVVTFVFAKNYQSGAGGNTNEWAAMSNISIPQANVLFSSGLQHTAFFTGVASQTNQWVYLVGRNKGSGTRANELSDTGYGTTTPVQQFSIGYGVEEAAVASLILTNEGDNGYESGGGVATALGIDGSCSQTDPFFPANSGWYAVGMLGCSDAITHGLAVSPNWLSFEGVPESDGTIEEGQYQLWGHEHMYGRHGISGYQDTDASKIFSGIQTAIGSNGSVTANHDPSINITYMNCTKSSDVAYPARNN